MGLSEILKQVKFAQVGFVVNDIEATGKEYAKLFGCPVPQTSTGGEFEVTQTKIFGEPAPEANARLAFFNLVPGVQLELIQPNEVPSVWRDSLEKYGEGIHHIAFLCEGADAVAKQLCDEFGAKIEQQGNYGDGSGQYIYVDCFEKLKCRIELLESFKK